MVNANVLLLRSTDSVLVLGKLTDGSGIFRFENVGIGKYLISCTYSGDKPVYTPLIDVTATDKSINLGEIRLQEKVMQMKEVVVIAKKPLYEQKIDRLVINVASAITYTGLSALDILERSPGVIVNRIAGSMSINGKSGVIVMINGKRNYMDLATVMQMLSGQPSGNIERIEVITTPPANFDAEGSAGIINIVLKSNNKYGTNGSFTLTAGYSKGAQNAASMNINHRKGKVNLFGNLSYTRNKMEQYWTNYRAIGFNGKLQENYSENNRHALVNQFDGQAGADLELSKKTIVGVLLSGNYRNWEMHSPNNASFSSGGQVDTVVKVDNNEVHNTLYYGVNFNVQHVFSAEEKLVFNADYLHYKDKNPNTYDNSYYMNSGGLLYRELVRSDKITPLEFVVLALDYNRKLAKKVDMEAGIKGSTSRSTNTVVVSTLDQDLWVDDSLLSGIHHIREKIGAAYTSFNIRFSDKTTVKAGLRYEFTHTRITTESGRDGVARDYGNLFPSLFFMRNIKDDQSFNFSYTRRIWRPSYSNLAPYVIFLDPKTFQTGNPSLQPSIIDALSASFSYKSKIFSVSYDHMANVITEIPLVDEGSNKMITAVRNMRGGENFNLSLNIPVKVNSWWNMQNYISGFWRKMIAFYKEEVITETTGIFGNTSQNFILPKNYSISLTAYYSSGGIWGLYRFRSMGSLDIGFQKKLTKARSTLSLNFSNILNTQKARTKADLPDQNLVLRNVYIYSYPAVNLSFSKNFGNDKIQGKRQRATGAEDEKGRAN